MSAVESALDVLSRAATMVQEERPKAATSLQRRPSSSWRKERRRAQDMSASRVTHHNRPSVIVPVAPQPGATTEDRAVTPTASATPPDAASGERTGIRNTSATSDPAIDEHFKRSLGLKEYAAVFSSSTTAERNSGLSVDDHFAKALGDAWTRLQSTGQNKDST